MSYYVCGASHFLFLFTPKVGLLFGISVVVNKIGHRFKLYDDHVTMLDFLIDGSSQSMLCLILSLLFYLDALIILE